MPLKRKTSTSASSSNRPVRRSRRTAVTNTPAQPHQDSESSDETKNLSADVSNHHLSDNLEEDNEDLLEDKPPNVPKSNKRNTNPNIPPNSQSNKLNINLENYNDVNFDMATINRLMSASGRQTRNRIPPAIQTELKNIQFMYRRAKKLLALVAHCSERTVNEFL
jgi:hypothetical protein